jgi:hypothetical protein
LSGLTPGAIILPISSSHIIWDYSYRPLCYSSLTFCPLCPSTQSSLSQPLKRFLNLNSHTPLFFISLSLSITKADVKFPLFFKFYWIYSYNLTGSLNSVSLTKQWKILMLKIFFCSQAW